MRTVYFDTSDFLRAHQAFEDPNSVATADSDFLNLFLRVSQTQRLVFSFTHLLEIGCGVLAEKRFQRAEWIDSLHKEWILPEQHLVKLELEESLSRFLGVYYSFSPFNESFISIFGDSIQVCHVPNALEAIKSGNPVARFMNEIFPVSGEGAAYSESIPRDLMKDISRTKKKIASSSPNYTFDVNDSLLDVKTRLREAHANLIRTRAIYVKAFENFGGNIDNFLNMVVEHIKNNLPALPLVRIQNVFNNALVGSLSLTQDESSGKFRKKHQGEFGDYHHLVGAAYCDVFTCDQRTSRKLGDIRERMGLSKQLSLGELGEFEFNRRLEKILSGW